jgi:hypothetical protein
MSSLSSSESERDEEESNYLIRHYKGSVICFNLRSFKRYSKACATKEDLSDKKISEQVSGGAMVARIHMDGCVLKGRSRPWMTVHQNSVQILNTPIIFDDIFIRKEDAARVFCFVKNYANRGEKPIKRFCEFKFHTSLEAEVFFQTYKTVIQTVVEHPTSANDNTDVNTEPYKQIHSIDFVYFFNNTQRTINV